jgi:hypothetical protein
MSDTINSIARRIGTFHHTVGACVAKMTAPISTALHKIADRP